MKKTNRKAFTIVELVIVIAVIGILAAVLIPTFSGIIKSANVANDQSMATNLTKELRLITTGNITNEDQLMEAVKKIDNWENKLKPKALNYDYHFWFNLETQTVFVETSTKVKDEYPAVAPKATAAVEQSGPVLASVELLADSSLSSASTFGNARDVFNKGYILMDSNLVEMFGSLAAIKDANSYANYFTKLNGIVEDKTYGEIAEGILANLKNTIVFNNNGIFHYGENATGNFVYFADDIEIISAKHYTVSGVDNGTLPTPKDGAFTLPSSVLVVEEGALNFTDSSVKINLGFAANADYSNITNIFAPKSTNANIVDKAGRTFNVTVADGTTHKAGDNIITKDTDILVESNEYRALLVPKSSFTEWDIGYELADSTQSASAEAWVKPNGDLIYVAYAADLSFFIEDTAGNKSDAVKLWESSDESIAKVVDGKLVITGEGEVIISASVVNRYGIEEKESVTLVINKPQSANIKDTHNRYYNMTSTAQTLYADWHYSGSNEFVLTIDGNVNFNESFAKGSEKLTIEIVDAENSMLALNGDKTGVTIKKDGNGNDVTTGSTTIKVSIDGCLETTIVINVINNSASPLDIPFYDKRNNDTYKYYVGDNNTIKLGNLFKVKTGKSVDLTDAILTVYDAQYGDGYYLNANGTGTGVTVELGGKKDYDSNNNYTPWKLTSGWATQTLQFSSVTAETEVWIKIAPKSAPAIFIKFVVVDATNYDKLTDIPATDGQIPLSDNTVVYGDSTINTGTTIEVGAGKTLYGNGFMINATTYVASDKLGSGTMTTYKYVCKGAKSGTANKILHALTHSVMKNDSCNMAYESTTSNCDYYETDAYMINLNDGKIDNIYINGPIYPELQYHKSVNTYNGQQVANTPYYVSGIKASAGSKILNSYVSGFRQAVEVNATNGSVEFNNTTIEGGVFANILWLDGDMKFHNVTTVQKSTGYASTVGTSKNVVGMGVAMEDNALNNKVTITGYFNQYNWVSKDTGSMLPVVDGINLSEIFNYVFDGVMGRKMGSVYFFVHQATDGKEYVNAGFVFVKVGSIEEIASYSDSGLIKTSLWDATGRESDGSYVERELVRGELSKLSSLSFSTEILGKSVGIDPAKHVTGKDAKIGLLTYKDGRNWTVEGSGLTSKLVEITTEEQKKNVVVLGNPGYEIDYSGYYTTYGK